KGDVVGFEEHSAISLDLVFQVLKREVERGSSHRGTAAAKGSDSILHDGGVAANDENVVDVDSELVGDDLSEGRFLALSVRPGAGHNGHLGGWVDLDGRAFPAARGSRG